MYRKILLTLDGSEMAEQALPVAINHSKVFQSKLYLLWVINPIMKSYRTGLATLSVIDAANEQLRGLAEDYLEGIANKLREDNLEVEIASQIGIPYKEIIKFSFQNKIDLIVMCTRGESGFTRWMLGSNTDYVIRGTKVPVLVVPAIEEQDNN